MAMKKRGTGSRIAIVYIHGIGAQSPPEILKRAWDIALFGRAMDQATRMAYWADIRHPQGRTVAARAVEPDDIARSRGAEAGSGAVGTRALRGRRDQPISAEQRAFEERLRASLEGPGAESNARSRYGARVLPLPGFLRRPITRLITSVLIKDTAAYLFNARQREAMRERLRDLLRGETREIVLVAHSQGTIIAHDVLHELGTSVNVRLLVTLGSPLGIQEVQDYLKPKPHRKPPGVYQWLNFADPLDPVSLDKGLATDFEPDGFIRDTLLFNRQSFPDLDFNPHAALGYLSANAVRTAVLDALPREDGAITYGNRIRKDVLRLLPRRKSRHDVLIEVVDEVAWPPKDTPSAAPRTLEQNRGELMKALGEVVRQHAGASALEDACIDGLKRYVSARLTSLEVETVATRFPQHVYAVWSNSRKRKLARSAATAVHADAARATFGATGKGITWAVLDTGVQEGHEHFATYGTIGQVWDCTKVGPPRKLKDARDPDGHGSHVSGIIAGADKNDPARQGVAPEARLVVYKVLNDKGSGNDGWIIKALDHIAETNQSAAGLVIHGVNLSLGGPFDAEVYGCGFSPVCQELRRLWQQGVVVCLACGNEGQVEVQSAEELVMLNSVMSIGDPANLEDAIAVGSINPFKPHLYGVSYFSSRGPTADGRAKPDLVAPGESIMSVDSGGGYISMSGTSMACPHVSGLIAAFLSVRTEFIGRPELVKARLMASCEDLGRDRYHQGAGLPSLLRMLTSS